MHSRRTGGYHNGGKPVLNDGITDHLLSRMTAGDWVLIKGSRGMKMEEVVDKLSAIIGRKGGNNLPSQEAQA